MLGVVAGMLYRNAALGGVTALVARLFFALWPDAAAAPALARLAGELAIIAGGKPVAADKAHLTLVFLGEVEATRIEPAIDAARGVRFDPFAFTLDCVGSFRGARVAWAGSLEPAAPLASLQSRLAGCLAAAGFALEERPFAAHVTLARRITRPVARSRIETVAWAVDAFSLVRSETGTGRYAILQAFAAG